MKKIFSLSFFAVLLGLQLQAQKVKTTSGSDDILKAESSVNIEFTYDNITVGKYNNEQDYIIAKTEEYNKKEAGKGDTWAASWKRDKQARFEPKFLELFKLTSGMSVVTDAKYTMLVKTLSIEPGWNIGISRKMPKLTLKYGLWKPLINPPNWLHLPLAMYPVVLPLVTILTPAFVFLKLMPKQEKAWQNFSNSIR